MRKNKIILTPPEPMRKSLHMPKESTLTVLSENPLLLIL